MKRIASIAAAVALGLLPGIGFAGSANGATTPGTGVAAQFCGLDTVAQTYTNCAPNPVLVSINYVDSIEGTTGTGTPCVPPGTTPIIQLVGPFRLAVNTFGADLPC